MRLSGRSCTGNVTYVTYVIYVSYVTSVYYNNKQGRQKLPALFVASLWVSWSR